MDRNLFFASTFIFCFLAGSVVYPAIGMAQDNSGKGSANATKIAVTEKGFEPDSVTVRANVPAKITFIRQTDKTCATEVVIPEYNIKRELPLNKPVVIEFTPKKAGDIAFACGMGMYHGKIVAQQQ